jgi:hypothetical protein
VEKSRRKPGSVGGLRRGRCRKKKVRFREGLGPLPI